MLFGFKETPSLTDICSDISKATYLIYKNPIGLGFLLALYLTKLSHNNLFIFLLKNGMAKTLMKMKREERRLSIKKEKD